MQSVSKENKKFRFILTVIDTFSKYAWAFPIKTKSKEDVCYNFMKLLKHMYPKICKPTMEKNFITISLKKI
ncbi:unnamed protein product [Parnassius mnemosyne]|uniref:Integrase catalytic domain-containing protein n=1 Tax=Parnassius mnemosyne TaxID=213953 RepID=A0AAV1L2Q8_9NEOP